MYFACRFLGYQSGTEPKLSDEHTEWKWQPVSELDGFEFIPGLKEQIKKAHGVYRREATGQ